jgi:hypothetical protein
MISKQLKRRYSIEKNLLLKEEAMPITSQVI